MAIDKLIKYTPNLSQELLQSENFDSAYGYGHIEIYKGVFSKLSSHGKEALTFEDGLKSINFLHAIYKSDEESQWLILADCLDSSRLGKKDNDLLEIYKSKQA